MIERAALERSTIDSARVRPQTDFLWSVADLLRGDYKQSEYGKVILPLVVLRRLDCVLEPTKEAVLTKHAELAGQGHRRMLEPILNAVAGPELSTTPRSSTSRSSSATPTDIAANLARYIDGFSARRARRLSTSFKFDEQIARLDEANLLYQVIGKFAEIDLHPDAVSNHEMGYIFEELIRRFSEQSNETAGEHFTPREVIRLMVNLLFAEDDDALTQEGHRPHALRPGLRHRRHALRRRGVPPRAEPGRARSRSSARS